MSIQTSDVQLKIKDKSTTAYLSAPEKGGPGVLLLHAWWGLKPYFKKASDQLAEQGFTVLAPDLCYGHVAQTIDEAKALMATYENEGMGEIVKAAKDHLSQLTNGKPIAVLGFSMGGYWSMLTAATEPDVAAAVIFYGSGGEDYSQVSAKVLGHFSDADEYDLLEGVRAWEAEMKAAGIDVTLHIYPNAAHWFMEEDRPEYDPAAAKLAWERTFEFLKKNLS
jgi:carboxymethylenebutenolidase